VGLGDSRLVGPSVDKVGKSVGHELGLSVVKVGKSVDKVGKSFGHELGVEVGCSLG